MHNTVIHGDAREVLRTLKEESIHLVVTDPPYASLEKHRAVGTTTRLTGDWFPVLQDEEFVEIFRQLYRVCAADAHLYVMFDQTSARALTPMAEAAGWHWWKWLVWDKQAIGMGYHFRAQHELIGFFEKGKRRLNDLGMGDVLSEKRLRGGYPTEKPVGLLERLVLQSSSPGQWVMDPFCGSGSAGVAAAKHGRNFLGVDVREPAVKLTADRLGQGVSRG